MIKRFFFISEGRKVLKYVIGLIIIYLKSGVIGRVFWFLRIDFFFGDFIFLIGKLNKSSDL